MKPITTFLKNFFAKERILGDDESLKGMVKADSLLNALVNQNKIPGLAITVLQKGSTVFQKGYGFADVENKIPVDPRRTIFRIASVSKPIAATALAHMVADGIIDLDTSFYNYVPYYPKKKYDFTIRQLAGHTAGIRSYKGSEYGLNKPYSIKDSIEIFKDDDLLFEPGTDYLYTSYDWVLISLAMQEASGIPFEKYVEEKVLSPLGMSNTISPNFKPNTSKSFRNVKVTAFEDSDTAEFTERITKFYSKNRLGFRDAIQVDNNYKLAGGGYLSTAEDIANFGQAYLDEKILPKDVLAPFLTSQTLNGTKTYYGLGWQVSEDKKGRKYYGHVGNGVGGYSNFYMYPEEQMVFSILMNCTNPQVQDRLNKLIAIILESKLIS